MNCCLWMAVQLSQTGTIFDPDPHHIWNRLHSFFFTRAGLPLLEEADPPFYSSSKFPGEDRSDDRPFELLNEFLSGHAEKLIRDPVKRALLQRDLWAAFDLRMEGNRSDAARRLDLQKGLVQVMKRLALTAEEIDRLSDNLAETVKSGSFPKTYEAGHPFLPCDLLDPKGPWVLAVPNRQEGLGVAAPEHIRRLGGRSLFFVFFKSEGSREETLRRIRIRDIHSIPTNQVALLRRMILFDTTLALRPTSITESLQFRVITGRGELEFKPSEFVLQRKDLRLKAISEKDRTYFLRLSGQLDPFEGGGDVESTRIMQSCVSCHGASAGRAGGFRSASIDGATEESARAEMQRQTERHLELKNKSQSWARLKELGSER